MTTKIDPKILALPEKGAPPGTVSGALQNTGPPEETKHDPPNTLTKNTAPRWKYAHAEWLPPMDKLEQLPPELFPNPPQRYGGHLAATIPNVVHLLRSYGISVSYNVIKKKMMITLPDKYGAPDNADNVAMTQIISLASLNGIPTGLVPSYVEVIADRNLANPVADWITNIKWDGVDRLPDFYGTLTEMDGFPKGLKELLMRRWLISAVAAALEPEGFRSRGVLTLQGAQSIGKTAWVKSLVPQSPQLSGMVKLDQHLDAGNKDSLLTAISHWIVEIGELESSFRKDIARLKGFLTSDRDKVRKPYARSDSEYPRRTVFCATVNDYNFLVDPTGNSRWWTIPVTKINYAHKIDMQQVFAQIYIEYEQGEPWWLTEEEEEWLDTHNQSHRTVSAVRDRVMKIIDQDKLGNPNLGTYTATEVLMLAGFSYPTNQQSKECASILRDIVGDSKRIQGRNKWRVPLTTAKNMKQTQTSVDDDIY